MLTDLQLAALDVATGSGLTTHPGDNALAALVIRAGDVSGDGRAFELVQAKRAAHRTWLTVTQRKWQAHTHRPSRARHHDSIAIREGYVRCAR